MREQQLFTKKDLYTRYSYKCDSCNKNVIDSLDKYYVVHRQWWDVEHICRDCAKSLLTTGRDSFMFYKGEIYARNAWVPTRNCIACNKLIYNDWCHQYCARCATTRQWCQSTYYCMNCWCVHDSSWHQPSVAGGLSSRSPMSSRRMPACSNWVRMPLPPPASTSSNAPPSPWRVKQVL